MLGVDFEESPDLHQVYLVHQLVFCRGGGRRGGCLFNLYLAPTFLMAALHRRLLSETRTSFQRHILSRFKRWERSHLDLCGKPVDDQRVQGGDMKRVEDL